MQIKDKLKRKEWFISLYNLYLSTKNFFRFRPYEFVIKYIKFFNQARELKNFGSHDRFNKAIYYPCLCDNLPYTPVSSIYLFQDVWAAGKIFQLHPKHHFDIGSSVTTMGIIAQKIPVTFVDIRPVTERLKNFQFVKASILNLPFKDNSIESLSSLCVVEHIGLGRYGDELDHYGSEKAIKELKRIVKPGGNFFLSLPVDTSNIIYFNAHRAFTHQYIIELLSGFDLIEEKFIYGNKIYLKYSSANGFGTGLFFFKKNS